MPRWRQFFHGLRGRRKRDSCPATDVQYAAGRGQSPRGLFQQVFRSAFSDSHNASVGLDGDDHVALIKVRIRIWRQVRFYPRDLHMFGRLASAGSPLVAAATIVADRDLRKDRRFMN